MSQNSNSPPVTTVWIVQPDSYKFNDSYVANAHVPGCFYLTEREAKIDAGYMNMQVLFEQWDWFAPPEGSALHEDGFGNELEYDDTPEPGELLKGVYQMSLDDACLFFAVPKNIESLMDEAGQTWPRQVQPLYMACELPLSGTEPEESDDDDESDAD